MSLIIRITKYLLNFVGLIWMFQAAYLSYGLIVRFPDCDHVMDVIKNVLKELLFIYTIFLIIAAGLNFIIERRFEKRKTTKEYLVIFFIELVILLLLAFFSSQDFYKHCGQPS